MNLILLFDSDFTDPTRTTVRLTGRRFEHAVSVCRIAAGDTLRVGLVDGNTGAGTVRELGSGFLEMAVSFDDLPPEPLPLALILALPRPKVLKRCLEVSATLGIKKIFIIETWRVEKSYWSSPVLAPEAIREHLLLGLEQGGDTAVPRVEIRRRFKPFVQDELPAIAAGSTALAGHPRAPDSCPVGVAGPVTLAIGPEGGFIPYEIDLLQQAGFLPVALGERILRVEQAIPFLAGRIVKT